MAISGSHWVHEWTAVYNTVAKNIMVTVANVAFVWVPAYPGEPPPPEANWTWTGNVKVQVSRTPDFSDLDLDYTGSPPTKQVLVGHIWVPDNEIIYVRVAGSGSSWSPFSDAKVFVTPSESYISVGGIPKKTSHFVKVSGTWKQAIRFVKVNGVWTQQ